MYGTVARLKVKPGAMAEMQAVTKEYENLNIPGQQKTYVFQMDADPDEAYLVAIFDSKDAYVANANDPAQHERYAKMRNLLTADPEWHDGEVVHAV